MCGSKAPALSRVLCFGCVGTPHPDSRKDKSRNGQHQQTQTAAQFDYPAKRVYETAAALLEQKKQADLLFPYLECAVFDSAAQCKTTRMGFNIFKDRRDIRQLGIALMTIKKLAVITRPAV